MPLTAGMTCLVTMSTYTADDDFSGADRIVSELGEPGSKLCVTLADMRALLRSADVVGTVVPTSVVAPTSEVAPTTKF
jgi:hypothetical protein